MDPAARPASPPPPTPPRPPLRRRREGRIIGGVAGGLADHLGIDVALVRIALVLLALFNGVGLLAYVIGWIAIPAVAPGTPVPPPRAANRGDGRDPLFWVGLGLLVIGAVALVSGPLSGVGVIPSGTDLIVPLVLIGFGLALWRSGEPSTPPTYASAGQAPPGGPMQPPGSAQPSGPAQPNGPAQPPGSAQPPGPAQPSGAAHAAAAPTSTTSSTTPDHRTESTMSATAPSTSSTPSSQAPAGPTAGELTPGGAPTGPQPPAGGGHQGPPPPTPSGSGDDGWTPPPVPERPRSWVARGTLGAVLVVVGVIWTLHLADVITLGLGEVFAIALLVVGVGLVVGSLVGRARWLILAGALLVPPVLAAQIALPGVFSWDFEGGAGELRVTASTVEELQDSYSLGAGSIRVDLTEMDFDGETVELDLSVGAGELRVIVPDDVEVEVQASTGIGQLSLLDEGSRGGVGPRDMTATATPDDPHGRLELEMSTGIGEIDVISEPSSR